MMKFTVPIPSFRKKPKTAIPVVIEDITEKKSPADKFIEEKTSVAVTKAISDVREKTEEFINSVETKKVLIGTAIVIGVLQLVSIFKKKPTRTTRANIYIYGANCSVCLAK